MPRHQLSFRERQRGGNHTHEFHGIERCPHCGAIKLNGFHAEHGRKGGIDQASKRHEVEIDGEKVILEGTAYYQWLGQRGGRGNKRTREGTSKKDYPQV